MSSAPLSRPVERIARLAGLDPAANALAATTSGRHGRVAEAARGAQLGHPVHPAFTDLPIGYWTSAFTLDLLGSRAAAPAARLLVGLGVVSAIPTIATGLVDVPSLTGRQRRVAVVHATANVAATIGYAASWALRRRRPLAGMLVGFGAAAAASAGGYLGGWLALGDDTGSEVAQHG